MLRFVSSGPPIWCSSSCANVRLPKVPSRPGSFSTTCPTASLTRRATSQWLSEATPSIYQKCPIQVAVRRELMAGEGAEDDDAVILGAETRIQLVVQPLDRVFRGSGSRMDGLPARAAPVLKIEYGLQCRIGGVRCHDPVLRAALVKGDRGQPFSVRK